MRAGLYSQNTASRSEDPIKNRFLDSSRPHTPSQVCSSQTLESSLQYRFCSVFTADSTNSSVPYAGGSYEIPSFEMRRSSPHHLLCAFLPVGGRRDSKNRLEARHWRAARQPRYTQARTERFD